jgi:Fe-S cluster assembly protein SufD
MAAPRPRSVEPVAAFASLFREAAPTLPGKGPVTSLRAASFAEFEALGLPTNRDEHWKYTNAARLTNRAMDLAPEATLRPADIEPWLAGGADAHRLVFVNGGVAADLSWIGPLPNGCMVQPLAKRLSEAAEATVEAMAALEDGRSFTALNAAFARDGAWIQLADGVEVEQPLQLLFVTVGETQAVMTHPRCIIRLGAGARLHLIESHVTLGDGACLTNLVQQVTLGEGANLRHDRLQLLGPEASLIGKLDGVLAGSARLEQTAATLGGGLVRNESEVRVDGSGIECLLNGVYMPTGKEHVDTLIRITHGAPGSHSDQFYKGVVDGQSHAAFQGKIIVEKPAQQTNAYQTNNNLLLSDDAELNTKPELEIYADDVKCSHGATCGDLDPRALFYLRSRGLDEATARSMLTFAFAAEVFERFADPDLKRQARQAALRRLPGGHSLLDMT